MRNGIRILILAIFLASLSALLPRRVECDEDAGFMVYSIYTALDMGNPSEIQRKDFYLNMGSQQGVREGSKVEVLRKVPTYNVNSKKLYAEMTFPIATLTIIHADEAASVARLDKMNAPEKTPLISPVGVMVGDEIRLSR